MSRIGNIPVNIPQNVKVTVAGGMVNVEGKEKLSVAVPPRVTVAVEDSCVKFNRNDDTRDSSAMQGLARSLVNNMVIGVTEGFKKELQIIGVGYRAQVSGSKLSMNLGFSHPVEYEVPEGVKVSVTDNTRISVEGADKQLVGEVAATIRKFRKPEPYKGKGVRYVDEYIAMKEGKSVG
jgi:large subunit ribosomal protein L6